MKNKLILLVLLAAVISTVFVSGCVSTPSGDGDGADVQGENELSGELDNNWIEEGDDITIGEMF